MIKISILICSLEERSDQLASLLFNLMVQCNKLFHTDEHHQPKNEGRLTVYRVGEVEIITCVDNRNFSTGHKRNLLYQMASGIYSVSIDDDDIVPAYYIEELLNAAASDADTFAINGEITTDGRDRTQWLISKDNRYVTSEENGVKVYLRYPNHITPIKTSITKMFMFPDITFGEDYQWATKIHNSGAIKTEYRIDKPMYHYKYISKK